MRRFLDLNPVRRTILAMPQLRIEKFRSPDTLSTTSPMTVNGTVIRTFTLLVLSAVFGVGGWLFLPENVLLIGLLLGAAGAFAFSFMAGRNPEKAKVPALLYAVVQGFLVGAIARMFETSYDGIVVTALIATASTVLATLVLYASGVVKVTAKMRSMVFMATGAVMVFYLVSIVLSLLGISIPFVFDAGPIGVGFSLLVIGIAVAGLFVDYSIVTEAMEKGADERFEWFAAFGITASVLWIFVEFLRLFSKLR